MITGPLSNRIFIQFTGKIPDLNGNGVDDAIDIDTGACSDDNGNGVCDDAETTRYRYAAKFICGTQPVAPSDGRLVKGHYATTINMLNVSDDPARIKKFLSLSYPPREQRQGDVKPIAFDILQPGHALKTDCEDVERRLFPNGFPIPYIEGYIALETATRLDVTGVYTSRDVIAAPRCGDGGHHGCKQRCDVPAGGCRSAPALSTTLEVVPVKEFVIEKKEPPETTCADLTVTDIGRPRVSCPQGGGSCVTQVDYTLQNIGDAVSGAFQSRATLDPRQGVVVKSRVPSLFAGATRKIQVVTPRGGNCFDPDCTVTIEADVSDRVMECREDNNTAAETTPG